MGASHDGIVGGYLGHDGNAEYLFRFLPARAQTFFKQARDDLVYDPHAGLFVLKEPCHLRRSPQGRHVRACHDHGFVRARHGEPEAVFYPGGTVQHHEIEVPCHIVQRQLEGVLAYGFLLSHVVAHDDVQVFRRRDDRLLPRDFLFRHVVKVVGYPVRH